jgi:hypothetical protein
VPEGEQSDPRHGLVYSEAVRTLEQQQAVVESLRSRAGTLLSAASIATSFLAGIALSGRRLDGWGWAATGSFVGLVGLCLAILWPTRRWIFRFNSKKLIRDYVEADPPATLSEMQRDLAIHMENWADVNSWKLRWLFSYFQAASLFLGAEVVFWIVGLRDKEHERRQGHTGSSAAATPAASTARSRCAGNPRREARQRQESLTAPPRGPRADEVRAASPRATARGCNRSTYRDVFRSIGFVFVLILAP